MAHRRANLSEALARLHGKIANPRQIRERQKPDKPALTGHGQASDLLARHKPCREIHIHVLRHAHKPLCHHAPHAHAAGRFVRRHTPDDQIAVRHHAGQASVKAPHREASQIVARHKPCRDVGAFVLSDANHVFCHTLLDLHRSSSIRKMAPAAVLPEPCLWKLYPERGDVNLTLPEACGRLPPQPSCPRP